MADSLPYDIFCKLLEYINIGQLNSVIHVFGNKFTEKDKQLALYTRTNINRYLKQLVPRPTSILEFMQDQKMILAGSRAAGYFNSSLYTDDSDWDFYMISDSVDQSSFASMFKDVLANAGAVIQDSCNQSETTSVKSISASNSYIFSNHQIETIYNIYMESNKKHRIQLIFLKPEMHNIKLSVFSPIIEYDLSALQCAVTGTYAISLYDNLTKNSKSIWWKAYVLKSLELKSADVRQFKEDNNELYIEEDDQYYVFAQQLKSRLNKYLERGLKIDDYVGEFKERYLGDKECTIVTYDNKITNKKFNPILDQDGESIRWIETYDTRGSAVVRAGHYYIV